MSTPKRAQSKSANKIQPYGETLAPALPVAPTLNLTVPAYRNLLLAGSIGLFCILSGILAGLAVHEVLTEVPAVKPGVVVELSNPSLGRITQAKAVADETTQTVQAASDGTALQDPSGLSRYQPGSSINDAQIGLSSYYLQGSVGISAIK